MTTLDVVRKDIAEELCRRGHKATADKNSGHLFIDDKILRYPNYGENVSWLSFLGPPSVGHSGCLAQVIIYKFGQPENSETADTVFVHNRADIHEICDIVEQRLSTHL